MISDVGIPWPVGTAVSLASNMMMVCPQRIALLVAVAALAADIVADPVADPGNPIHGDEIVDVTFPPGGAKLGLAFYRPLVPPTISLVAPGSLAAATA
eukprot:COSAG06_NODE_9772_length_1820_cov_144.383498_3_plen_97_part_01